MKDGGRGDPGQNSNAKRMGDEGDSESIDRLETVMEVRAWNGECYVNCLGM